MPIYKAKYMTREGKRETTMIRAASRDEAFDILARQGKTPLSLQWDLASLTWSRVRTKDLAEIMETLSWLFASGVDLRESLDIVIVQAPSETASTAMREVLRGVEAGEDLAQAMKSSGFFPDEAVALTQAASSAGERAAMLGEYAEELRWRDKMSSGLKSRMIYPAVVILATMASAVFLLTYVLPQLSLILPEEKLPASTRIAMSVAMVLKSYWFVIIPILASLFILGWRAFLGHRDRLFPLLARVKPLRLLIRGAHHGRFFSTLGMLIKARTPLTEALSIAAGSDPYLDGFSKKLRGYVSRGSSLWNAVADDPVLGRDAGAILAAGQRSGRLADACRRLGRRYQEESRRVMENLSEIIQPVVILLSGGVLVVILFAVFRPLYGAMGGMGASFFR